jgi:hypothetical protein
MNIPMSEVGLGVFGILKPLGIATGWFLVKQREDSVIGQSFRLFACF